MSGGNLKSGEEEFCHSQFNEFLHSFPSPSTIHWDEVPQHEEPPDYYVTLDGKKYAVEVTTLMETISVGRRDLPQIAIVQSLWSFVDEVEATAKRYGCLNGTYVVGFIEPIDNFGSVKDEIQERLLEYVERTQHVDAAPEKTVFGYGSQQCWIEKVHGLSDQILKGGPTNVKWEGEAAIEICNLLKERLNDKRYKLRNVLKPKILLLYDHYRFANQSMFKACVDGGVKVASFHTVFVIRAGGNNFTLSSENKNWL